MRRQIIIGGPAPAGPGRAPRLDPQALPVAFTAHDTRADGSIRHIELHRERVVLRRAVAGMKMAINVAVRDFLGLALRGAEGERALVLVHRDPALSIPLCVTSDEEAIASASALWCETFALPLLGEEDADDTAHAPAQRRRRRNAVAGRRPKFLVRRRVGAPLAALSVFTGEREVIARD